VSKQGRPDFDRLLVVLPSWVGDVVMATPTLRIIRKLKPEAHISYLVRSYVKPIIDAAPWYDRLVTIRPRRAGASQGSDRRRTTAALTTRLRRGHFDTAVLLPNSFRTALIVKLAGIDRRIGYDRDGRGLLLTDRLLPVRDRGRFVPTPMIDYYLGLAQYLGAENPPRRMQLFTREADDRRAEQLLASAGVAQAHSPVVMLTPGAANKGDAKLWPAERFAAAADHLVEKHNAVVLLSGAPAERPILDTIHRTAKHKLIDLPRLGSDLAMLKSLVRACDLMITNDTGPRHIAAALNVPVISLFGPTDPAWTQLDAPSEHILQSKAPDGAMTGIDVKTVTETADQVLATTAA